MKETSTNNEYIESAMKRFKLVDMRQSYLQLIKEAEITQMGYEDFLIRLLQSEDEGKRLRHQERLKNKACFELSNTLDDIDYSFNPTLDQEKIKTLGKLDFIKYIKPN